MKIQAGIPSLKGEKNDVLSGQPHFSPIPFAKSLRTVAEALMNNAGS